MRRFELHRDVDETGISGTGVVAEGVEFNNGKVALGWGGALAVPSVAVFENITQVEAVHGHGGKTRIVWIDRQVGSVNPNGSHRAKETTMADVEHEQTISETTKTEGVDVPVTNDIGQEVGSVELGQTTETETTTQTTSSTGSSTDA